MAGIAPDYVDVAERIREFREKHPEGSLQQVEWHVETIGDRYFIVYTAAAYRSPDDQRPGQGTAWEPFPGKTNFTRDSELQNAETSAWGRAIIAAGAADAKKVASANEVVNRRNDDQPRNERPPQEHPVQELPQTVDAAKAAMFQLASKKYKNDADRKTVCRHFKPNDDSPIENWHRVIRLWQEKGVPDLPEPEPEGPVVADADGVVQDWPAVKQPIKHSMAMAEVLSVAKGQARNKKKNESEIRTWVLAAADAQGFDLSTREGCQSLIKSWKEAA